MLCEALSMLEKAYSLDILDDPKRSQVDRKDL